MAISTVSPVSPVSPIQNDSNAIQNDSNAIQTGFEYSKDSILNGHSSQSATQYIEGLNSKAIHGKIVFMLGQRYSLSYAKRSDYADDILQNIMMLIWTRFYSGLRLSDIVILNSIRHFIKKLRKPMSALPTIVNDNGDYSQGDIWDYSVSTLGEVLYNEILSKVGDIAMMVLQGFNGKEIALSLDISEATASRRIEIAKDQIRSLMGI